MALNLRKYLAELLHVQQISDEDVRKELDELKIDNELEALTRDGHVPANPEAQSLARKAITGQASAEDIKALLKTPRPIPAQANIVVPPAGPLGASADSTEAAIQAHMAANSVPYHEAASAVAAGGALTGGGE